MGLGSRCIDFGGEAWWAPGAPVIIYGCNGSVAQQVRIKEIDSASHDVELRVQNRFCLGVRGGVVVPGQPMEIQNCNGSPAQRFAIDGDALLVGAQTSGRVTREYVLEPDGGRTVARTPLVGVRQLVDSEYFRFQAVDGSGSRPTSGFIGVTTEAQLDAALTKGWGTVIELNASFTLNGSTAKTIGAGMTLRGYRKFGDNGVQLLDGGHVPDWALFTDQDNVRITGFRMRGRADVASTPPTTAINVGSPAGSRVFVDHMDITFWNGSGVGAAGGARFETCPTPGTITDWLRKPNITIVGNFIAKNHDYGVVSSNGAFLYIQGNHMYENAHDIASDPWGSTGYAAFDNVVVSPTSGSHDFDIHGSLHPGHWFDGISGDAFEIGFNTFMPTNHPNFNDRGTPCRFVSFHDNVTPLSQADAFLTRSTDPNKTVISSNIFSSPNPISDLGVGDFDGDGVDDVFVGTGKVWYFSSSGRTEWRYLNRMPEKASQLRFGDFDNDGRTDVLALHGTTIDVSWAGVTPWQHVSSTSVPLADIAIGDFDGDHYADVFIATGTEWLFQPAGGIFGHSFQHFADFELPREGPALRRLRRRPQKRRPRCGLWAVDVRARKRQHLDAAPLVARPDVVAGRRRLRRRRHRRRGRGGDADLALLEERARRLDDPAHLQRRRVAPRLAHRPLRRRPQERRPSLAGPALLRLAGRPRPGDRAQPSGHALTRSTAGFSAS